MNQAERLNAEIDAMIDGDDGKDTVEPSSIALALVELHGWKDATVEIRYLAFEHAKQMTRARLRRRFADTLKGESEGDMPLFSGKLQDWYPVPRDHGEEPMYVRRRSLTDDQRAWCVAQLRKAAKGLAEHANALEAEGVELRMAAGKIEHDDWREKGKG